MTTYLEQLALDAWRHQGWALATTCHGCGRITYCRGRTRKRLLCIECFDTGPPRKEERPT